MSDSMSSPDGPANAPTVPDGLVSPQTKLVYLYLATVPEATVDEIARVLDVDRLSLYPVLSVLTSRGLIERDGVRCRCRE